MITDVPMNVLVSGRFLFHLSIKIKRIMRNISIIFATLALTVSVSFAQKTTNSTSPKQEFSDENNKKNAVGERQNDNNAVQHRGSKTTTGAKRGNGGAAGRQSDPGVKPASAAVKGDAGVASGKTAPSGGKGGEKTVSQGAIVNTPPDTIVKKGSGSGRRNMKNQTGKTGNYKNEEARKNGRN
jgi:hypothetical protein